MYAALMEENVADSGSSEKSDQRSRSGGRRRLMEQQFSGADIEWHLVARFCAVLKDCRKKRKV